MQRSISLQQSFILLSLGLAFWLAAQDWLLPRVGLQPMESMRPRDGQPIAILGSTTAPSSLTTDSEQPGLLSPFSRHRQLLNLLQWQTRLGGIAGPSSALFFNVPSVAHAPEPQGETGKVVIDLSDRQVYVYPDRTGKSAIAQYDIAIGQDGWETPPGRYLIEGMQRNPTWQHPLTHEVIPPGPKNPLGAAWISFLTTDGYSLGLHGTIDESLVGQAVSHGCVRMRNADILALYERVALGWPLDVQP